MTIKNYRTQFSAELSSTYPKTEIDSFFFILINEYFNLNRIDVTLNPGFKINNDQFSVLNIALNRLKNEEPIQYIIGNTEFYGFPFLVNENTLIPRPETEELVEWILDEIVKFKSDIPLNILDIGTGSGCIPISLAKNLSNVKVSAIDVSLEALKVANQNATLNDVAIEFIELNILETKSLPENFDIIISNPPYVRELEKAEIQNNVLQNEPHLALFVSNENPLIFYNKIADLAQQHLTKNGLLFFEINQYLGNETEQLLAEKGFKNIELRKDLFGNERMIKATIT